MGASHQLSRWAWLAALVLAVVATANAQPPPGVDDPETPTATTPATPGRMSPRRARVWHLRVLGDLDCARLVRDVSELVNKAESDGATMLILELDGDRSSPDVVWSIAQSIRSSAIPTHAFLADSRESRVGTGQAALALIAAGRGGACWILPGTSISRRDGDDLRPDEPDDMDFERINRELQGSAWARLKDRGIDTEVASVLLSPASAGPAWALPAEPPGAPWRITSIRPPANETQAVRIVTVVPTASKESSGASQAGVEIPYEVVRALGLASEARSVGEIGVKSGLGRYTTVTHEVRSGLSAARKRVEGDAAKVDAVLAQADQVLRDIPSVSRADYAFRKARAGKDALALLANVQPVIDRTERLMVDYPELLRNPVPGRTIVGVTSGSLKTTWRISFDRRRDELARLESKARQYAGK
ncbi:MAG: hypothetical protein KF745_12425 [Phycisphaeraceae bacterium]|nr:hypothetical protein [Phycisphaeraceae bacterium]